MRFKKLISIVTLFTLLCFSTAFATTTSLFPYPKFHAVTSTGAPLSGGKLYTYEPGTTTPKTTYIDSAGTIANTNPVILNTNGDATIYFVGVYDIVLISSTGTMQWSLSSVSGINSTTTNSVASEWILQSLTSLTYIGATQFSAAGDVRTTFPAYIRVKAVVTAGIIYGSVSTSSFGGGVTTVTVSWDSGSLDSGLSAVSTGILTPTNTSIPVGSIAASAAEDLANASSSKVITPTTNYQLIKNLKPVVDASLNQINIYTKSGGAIPSVSNIITIAIPDGNGYTFRSRSTAYLSGSAQISLADATNYWNRSSSAGEIRDAYLYAIWDGTGIVWALSGYSGFTMVPTTVTVTDDDYFLLETSSTYVRSNSHYCICVARVRYTYSTADTPDYTFLATVENAPQVIWNPKSDYGYIKTLTTSTTQAGDFSEFSALSLVLKQTGKYKVSIQARGYAANGTSTLNGFLKTGSSTYGSASYKINSLYNYQTTATYLMISGSWEGSVTNGDTVHFGISLTGTGNKTFYGDDQAVGVTAIIFQRID